MPQKINLNATKKELSKYEVLDSSFYNEISDVIYESRRFISTTINHQLVLANWKIGKMIYEKQKNLPRAEYGEKLISELSEQMTKDFGKGYTITNLKNMRMFCKTFQKGHTLCDQLSWSHYRLLITVKNDIARNFYYEQAIKNQWSVRQLAREIHSIAYERYILGNKNYAIIQETADLAKQEESEEETRLFVKEPLLFDFLGFKPGHEYFEKDLEQAIIDHLEEFLLELGQGYTFVARQKRIVVDDKNYYIDLLLYNIVERCYILIDLKIGEVEHRDLGQMQMYVNYFTEHNMLPGDAPPIGMILCADKSDKIIKYTLGPNNKQVRAYKYTTNLIEGDLIKEEAERFLKQIKKDDDN